MLRVLNMPTSFTGGRRPTAHDASTACGCDVRFWHLADIAIDSEHVRFWGLADVPSARFIVANDP